MKKPLIVVATVVAVAFAAVWFRRQGGAGGTTTLSRPDAAEVERVKDFWAAYNRANALRAQGDFTQAVPAFRKALELNPSHEDSLYYLGTSLYEIGDYQQAADEFRKIIAANPASGRAWSQLGNTLSVDANGEPKHYAEAQHAYERSAQLNPEQAGPFLGLGLLDLKRGRLDRARENFRIAAGFGSPEGSYLLAYTFFLERREREALPLLCKILNTYAREKKIIGRGVLSEGDLLPGPGKPLTELDKSALRSIVLVNRIARRLGSYPAEVPKEFCIQTPLNESAILHALKAESGLEAGARPSLTPIP